MDSPWIISGPLTAVEAITAGGVASDCPSDSTMPLRHFVASLEDLAARLVDPAAIWRAGEVMDLAHLSSVGMAMSVAPTLGAAMRCFVSYFGAVQSATSLELERDGDLAALRYRVLDEDIWPRAADAQLTLGLVAGIIKRYAPDADRALVAQFEDSKCRSAQAISAHLARPIRGGSDNALIFPARLLERGLPRPDMEATGFRDAVQALEQHLRKVRVNQPVSDRVMDLLLRRMGQEAVDQDAIARDMGMSRRTLRRRLELEGSSFHELNEICRRNIGRALLTRSDLPMIEIALRLGYSDHTAFSRAFSRWFGMSPRDIRKARSGSSAIT